MKKNLVFNTMAFAPRQAQTILRALKAEAFQLGTKRQYYVEVVPNHGHEQSVATICGRLFQAVPAKEAQRVLTTFPKVPLK